MLFGVRLANEVYPPWKADYIAYEKLKKLLKESVVLGTGQEQESWTESDESKFVAALDQDLEKVYSFENKKYTELSDKISAIEKQVEDVSATTNINPKAMEQEMEEILEVATQLERFSRLNYTGFVKIVKKHDRLHSKYQVKPLLHVRLSALPFHTEDYSPLLYRLSKLYTILSDNFSSSVNNTASARMSSFHDQNEFQKFKFWVHKENIMEVKTKILRHLPVLVYNREGKDGETGNIDPIITSLYFDNSSFDLYESELEKKKSEDGLSSLRLRWYGNLKDRPEIILEKRSTEGHQIKLKEKYIDPFLKGEQSVVDKHVKKMRDRSTKESEVEQYKKELVSMQELIKEQHVSPVLRTVYTRTAFQIPGDDRVRVILDSDITFIREDSFNLENPIRDPSHWRRADLDLVDNDFSHVRKNEVSKFPYAVLELRLKAPRNSSEGSLRNTRHGAWIEELVSSQLIKEVPQFSKFVQGIASLFAEDDRLDALPFWLPDLEHDIRQDPTDVYKRQRERLQMYREEQQRRLGSSAPVEPTESPSASPRITDDDDSSEGESETQGRRRRNRLGYPTWESHGPKLDLDSEDEEVVLPPGVIEPKELIKNQGTVKVETKVWLANERTFNKWLSVTTLLSAMTFSLYNSVKSSISTSVAERVSYVLFALTLFTGIWGYTVYMRRLRYIKERSERHLDASFGPIVVAVTLLTALSLNFYITLKNNWHYFSDAPHHQPATNGTAF